METVWSTIEFKNHMTQHAFHNDSNGLASSLCGSIMITGEDDMFVGIDKLDSEIESEDACKTCKKIKTNNMLKDPKGILDKEPVTLDSLLAGPSEKPKDNTKAYICCKIIRAEPISHELFLRQRGEFKEGQETWGEGYKVIYPDDYESFSPKHVFEQAYREISNQEFRLIHK